VIVPIRYPVRLEYSLTLRRSNVLWILGTSRKNLIGRMDYDI
jgi:hypothetical protein